jgi:hypothetical protein
MVAITSKLFNHENTKFKKYKIYYFFVFSFFRAFVVKVLFLWVFVKTG